MNDMTSTDLRRVDLVLPVAADAFNFVMKPRPRIRQESNIGVRKPHIYRITVVSTSIVRELSRVVAETHFIEHRAHERNLEACGACVCDRVPLEES